jgi:hypothetical protein
MSYTDAFEIPMESLDNKAEMSRTFSHYKNRNTLKALVAIGKDLECFWVSKLYGANGCSDSLLVKDGKDIFDRHLHVTTDMVAHTTLADKGFQSVPLDNGDTLNFQTPAFLQHGRFSKSEVISSFDISRKRIHIERFIARLKAYRMLQHVSITSLPYISQVLHVICFIQLFKGPIYAKRS